MNPTHALLPSVTPAPSRARAIAVARSWIGTPYHHQASLKSIGADCLGLIRGVYRELYGHETESPPAYSRDWAETTGEETLWSAADRHLTFLQYTSPEPGDILLFRLRPGLPAKHVGLLTTAQSFVHAMEGGPAAETPFSPWWRRRVAAAFSFPGISS